MSLSPTAMPSPIPISIRSAVDMSECLVSHLTVPLLFRFSCFPPSSHPHTRSSRRIFSSSSSISFFFCLVEESISSSPPLLLASSSCTSDLPPSSPHLEATKKNALCTEFLTFKHVRENAYTGKTVTKVNQQTSGLEVKKRKNVFELVLYV